MLKLIHIEFLKLRRQKQLGFSLLGLTCWVILPFICGILSVLLMYNEQHVHIKRQLWLASVSKLNYFLSKFFALFIYSFIFILLSCIWTFLFASFSQNVTLTLPSILWLIKKWIEISILFPLAMLPILTAATFGKGYILPICLDLFYIFSGFIMASQTFYIHPYHRKDTAAFCNPIHPSGCILYTEAAVFPFYFFLLQIRYNIVNKIPAILSAAAIKNACVYTPVL